MSSAKLAKMPLKREGRLLVSRQIKKVATRIANETTKSVMVSILGLGG